MGANGHINGANGHRNGTNGHINGANGHLKGTNGHLASVSADSEASSGKHFIYRINQKTLNIFVDSFKYKLFKKKYYLFVTCIVALGLRNGS